MKYRSTALPMRAHYKNQAQSSNIPASCKVLYKCDERSGFSINAVTGHKYDPANLVVKGGTNNGYLAFTEPNAINFGMNTEGISVITEFNQTFNTRKIILLAAHILPIDSGAGYSNTRIAIGTLGDVDVGDSAALSLSFAGSMHVQLDITGNGSDLIATLADATARITHFNAPLTIYGLWNGIGSSASVNGTLTAKALNADGTVYNNGVTASNKTVSGIISSNTFTPGNMMRPAWAHYYKMEAWELDYLPPRLDFQLAIWGDLARQGYKGAVTLVR